MDASSAPRDEARVRTSESGTAAGSDESTTSERTFGPIGLKGLSDDESGDETASAGDTPPAEATAGTTATASTNASPTTRTAATEETRPPDTARSRTPATDETAASDEGLTSRIPWSISVTAIGVGVGLLVFIDIVSLMVPLLAAIGAGIVGGFVAGYIAGGTFRGALHALAVGIIGGIMVGYLTALIGALIGLFMEPATLLGGQFGPVAAIFGGVGEWGPILVMVLVTAMVAIDATIAGVVGGTFRSMVDEVR